jgi:hypothetical protein
MNSLFIDTRFPKRIRHEYATQQSWNHPLSHRDPVEMMAERGVAAAQAFFRKALGSTHPRVSRKVTLNGYVPSRRTMAAAPRALVLAQRKGPGEQVVEQSHRARPPRDQATLRVDRWIRIGPPHSQGTIFVRPWPSAPWLVAQGGMGDRTCMREREARNSKDIQQDRNIPRCTRAKASSLQIMAAGRGGHRKFRAAAASLSGRPRVPI